MAKIKGQKDKQWSTRSTQKTTDWATTLLKTRVNSGAPKIKKITSVNV